MAQAAREQANDSGEESNEEGMGDIDLNADTGVGVEDDSGDDEEEKKE